MIYLFSNKKELTKIIPRGNLIGAIQELEINGLYLAEVEVPLFFKTEQGQVYNHKKSFDSAAFFGFFDLKKNFQLYKIHTRKVDGRTLTVSGVHLFFDEAKAMTVIRDKRLVSVDAKAATDAAFSGTGWIVKETDVTSLKSLDFYYETPQDARKRIIELWNIEFDYDFGFDGRKITSKNMYIKKKLGQWTGDRYAYGTNILSIVQEQDEAEVFTAAIGRGKADDTNSALNSKVLFDELAWSKDGYTKPVGQDYIEIVSATQQYGYYDAAGNVKPRIALVDFDDEQDQQVLADKTYEWLKQNCVPKVSYETTVAKSGDYYLGDEIGIIYKDIDIVKKARVEKIRVNLLNPKLSELGLGDYSFFKQDRFKKNVKNDIATVKKDTLTGLQKLRQDFSDNFDAQKQEIDAQIQQVEINAQAQVTAAETRMHGEIDTAKSTLSTDITASYNNAVTTAESKAKEMDAVISGELTSAKSQLNTSITNSYNNAVSSAQTKVSEAEARLNTAINNQKAALTTDINNSYTKAVTDAETKAKALDAVVSQQITDTKNTLSTDINTAYTNAVSAAEAKAKALDASITQTVTANKQAADSALGTLNTALSSTNSKVGTIEQNVTAAQNNITTLTNTTNSQQTAINQAKQDISGLTTTVGGHTSKISDMDGKIALTATKTEVQSAVDGIVFGGVNLIRNSNYEYPKPTREYLQTVDLAPIFESYSLTQKYSLSMDIKSPIAGIIQVYMQNGSGTKYSFVSQTVQVTTEWQRFKFEGLSPVLSKATETKAILSFYGTYDSGRFPIVRNIQLEIGTKATPYDISPLDRDALISQNSAAIVVANNEITKRVTKTEYDTRTGQIEQTANTAKSTADTNSQTITTVKGNVDSLTQWRADKGTAIDQTIDAVSTKAWLTDISPIDGRLQTAEANITTNANEILKRVTKTVYDADTQRIEGTANTAKSTADSNTTAITTVSGKVGALEQWRTDKGSQIDQTINAVTTKVWTNDIDAVKTGTTNLVDNNSIVTGIGTTKEMDILGWAKAILPKTWVQIKIKPSTTYTVSYDVQLTSKPSSPLRANQQYGHTLFYSPTAGFTVMAQMTKAAYESMPVGSTIKVVGTFTTPASIASDTYILAYTAFHIKTNADGTTTNEFATMKYKNFMLVEGNKVGSYQPAPEDAENKIAEIKVTADGALTKATNIGNDYVKQSAVLVQPDGVLIGSKKVSGTEIASAISVTPSNVDIITKVMRVTGDMVVAGDIKSLSLSAVNADIANLRASILTADSVTATALKADTALITKLNTNALLTNYLTADTAMINSIKTNAITAVRADVAWLKANVITADSIDATALKVDTALMDKLNANSILTKTLVADSVLTDTIKTKSLDAVYADIATLKSSVITAGSITADALNVDAAMIDKLDANEILAKKIVTDVVFADTVKTKSLEAVNADIANLKAKIITADSIDATALKVDTALMDKLNANSILTNKLIADTAMINAIKSNSITATRGDIAWLKSNIITADSITSTAIKSDTAMIDKLFASSALIDRLTSKQAFIDNINSISVTANSVMINSVKGELNKPNSGLKITRPDGAVAIDNGMIKNESMITTTMPYFMSSVPPRPGQPFEGIAHFYQKGTYYGTNRNTLALGGALYSNYGRLAYYHFFHGARYVVLTIRIKVNYTGGGCMVRNSDDSIYKIVTAGLNDSKADSNGEVPFDITVDLGTPTYQRKEFYVYFRPIADGPPDADALIRILDCRVTDYL
ncbi:phage tail spike protein [Macrococcus equipercicus]|uniref:Phage tail protein n=1 Tax=Macrococcus equipercicus TaxID=69967 RepID=A0A9Q9F3W1_9STAP|nr:phage tail spike protein [Macrococcus equipercicus]UTH14774.1 phage tail protein [Macrococcus equipercicus]